MPLAGVEAAYDATTTTLWILLAIVVVLVAALMTYVALRDGQRMPSGDGDSAGRAATSEAERYAAQRHAAQGRNVGDSDGPAGTSGGAYQSPVQPVAAVVAAAP